jgi:predicted TIM-barrel enzyme
MTADKLIEQTGVIEKTTNQYFRKLEGAFIGSYIHSGNKIATLVSLSAVVEVLKKRLEMSLCKLPQCLLSH